MIKTYEQYTATQAQLKNLDQNDILIVVDVQDKFSDFIPKNFVKNLFEYCEEFRVVYQIWDSNNDVKTKKPTIGPSYTFPNQKGCYEKKYGTTFSDKIKKDVDGLKTKYPNAKEGTMWKIKDGYIIRIKNNHGYFYINDELVDFFKTIKGKKVVVCGGAGNECLRDFYVAIERFGVIPTYNSKFTYSAETNSNQVSAPYES